MLVGLIATVVMFQVFAVSEGQKRTTTGAGDAQQNGVSSVFLIERDARMAGYGMNYLPAARLLGQRLLRADQHAVHLPHGARTRSWTAGVTADTLTIVYGDTPRLHGAGAAEPGHPADPGDAVQGVQPLRLRARRPPRRRRRPAGRARMYQVQSLPPLRGTATTSATIRALRRCAGRLARDRLQPRRRRRDPEARVLPTIAYGAVDRFPDRRAPHQPGAEPDGRDLCPAGQPAGGDRTPCSRAGRRSSSPTASCSSRCSTHSTPTATTACPRDAPAPRRSCSPDSVTSGPTRCPLNPTTAMWQGDHRHPLRDRLAQHDAGETRPGHQHLQRHHSQPAVAGRRRAPRRLGRSRTGAATATACSRSPFPRAT